MPAPTTSPHRYIARLRVSSSFPTSTRACHLKRARRFDYRAGAEGVMKFGLLAACGVAIGYSTPPTTMPTGYRFQGSRIPQSFDPGRASAIASSKLAVDEKVESLRSF